MYLFDTNIFLEILLDQKQATVCQQAIEFVNQDKPGWVTSFSLHAIEVLTDRAKKRSVLENFLSFLLEHPHFYEYATTLEEERDIVRWLSKTGLDFDDTLQYYVARKKGLALVTLDRDFEKVRGVKVLSPQEV